MLLTENELFGSPAGSDVQPINCCKVKLFLLFNLDRSSEKNEDVTEWQNHRPINM